MEALTPIKHLVGAPYQYQHGPERAGQQTSLSEGINCQLLVHLAIRALRGYVLPPTMKSQEFLEDQHHFRDVDPSEPYDLVDVFVFGKPHETDFKKLHPAVCVAIEDEPLLLHATVITHAVSLWSLQEFSRHGRYQRLFAVKRLKSS